MIDESTSVSSELSIWLFIWDLNFKSKSIHFFGLVPVVLASADGLKNNLCNFLFSIELSSAVQVRVRLDGGLGFEPRQLIFQPLQFESIQEVGGVNL